jgi:hypothetical protein
MTRITEMMRQSKAFGQRALATVGIQSTRTTSKAMQIRFCRDSKGIVR